MRFIALTIAVLTLSLSLVPCSDSAQETVENIDKEQHSEHSDDKCSPFCICACCGIAISIENTIFEDRKTYAFNVSHYFTYQTNFTKGFSRLIWHPPAIV